MVKIHVNNNLPVEKLFYIKNFSKITIYYNA